MSRSYRIVEFDDGVDEYIVEFTIEGVTRTMLVAPVIDVDGVTINQELTRKKIQQAVGSYVPETKAVLRNPRDMVGTTEDVAKTSSTELGVDINAAIAGFQGD